MAEALRAALRLLPVVKPNPSGVACSRASAVRRSNNRAPEQQQSVLFAASPSHQQQVAVCERNLQSATGFARFARAVLAYVGAGISAVTANQLAGPAIVHAKELPSSGGDKHAMAAAEARAVWQRTATNRHLVQEDTVRAPKLAHCPTLSKAQADICHPGAVRGVEHTHSFYWSNSWGSLDNKADLQWQLSPSAHRDYRAEYLGLDDILGSRLCKPAGLQALAAERSNMKGGSPGLMGVTSEYATGAELELEWQLIVDPKPKSGLSASFQAAEAKERNEEESASPGDEDSETAVPVADYTGKNVTMTELSVMKNLKGSKDVLLNPSADVRESWMTAHGVQQQESMEKCQQISEKPVYGGRSVEISLAPKDVSAKSSPTKSSVSWRTANKEALAALVAQKAAERLENCDLPTPQSKSVLKAPLESCDLREENHLDMYRSVDRILMASIFQAGEPTHLESLGLPASPLIFPRSDPNPPPCHFPRVSQPLSIPTTLELSYTTRRGCHSFSADNRNTSWNGGGGVISSSLGKGSGPLGEALCHSQTRAREAEKRADQSFQEYKKLSHLFFREASLSLTYRQWVSSLQAENTRLKMYVRNQHAAVWLQQSFFSPFTALDRLSNNRWKNYGKDHAHRQMREHFSAIWPEKEPMGNITVTGGQDGADIIMGCTLGFAFALGLSLAGAGLMLGWSMGWILLAY